MRQEVITLNNLEKFVEFESGEIWKPLRDYKDKWDDTYRYFISSHGRVYGTKKRRLLKPFTTTDKDDHLNVRIYTNDDALYGKPIKLHSLVAEHFLIKPDDYDPKKYVIHHIDLNPQNNNIDNLVYIPYSLHLQFHNYYKKCRDKKDKAA